MPTPSQALRGPYFLGINPPLCWKTNARRDGLWLTSKLGGQVSMAKRQKYQVEKTSVGMQFVIPGTERVMPAAIPSRLYETDGVQFVIPGAEQTSTGELLMRKMAEPIRPRTRQRGLAGTALFGGR